jgi:cyclophilin family peptidyl-prolyl cis-trans isomerase
MVTFGPCPYFDHKQVVFGEVIDGLHLLDFIENAGIQGGIQEQREDSLVMKSGSANARN